MLLCIEAGVVSPEDADPLLRRDVIDLDELIEDRRELRVGVGGSGFSSSLPNSRNNLSKPGCICRAIMGKWFRRSLKDLTSFLRGIAELGPAVDPPAVPFMAATSFLTSSVAGIMGAGSHVPTKGFDM